MSVRFYVRAKDAEEVDVQYLTAAFGEPYEVTENEAGDLVVSRDESDTPDPASALTGEAAEVVNREIRRQVVNRRLSAKTQNGLENLADELDLSIPSRVSRGGIQARVLSALYPFPSDLDLRPDTDPMEVEQ